VAKEAAEGRRREEKDTMEESFIFSRTWRGVAWRGVAWRGEGISLLVSQSVLEWNGANRYK
jgi:hypothetical protein